jgi:hypothetical protein
MVGRPSALIAGLTASAIVSGAPIPAASADQSNQKSQSPKAEYCYAIAADEAGASRMSDVRCFPRYSGLLEARGFKNVPQDIAPGAFMGETPRDLGLPFAQPAGFTSPYLQVVLFDWESNSSNEIYPPSGYQQFECADGAGIGNLGSRRNRVDEVKFFNCRRTKFWTGENYTGDAELVSGGYLTFASLHSIYNQADSLKLYAGS